MKSLVIGLRVIGLVVGPAFGNSYGSKTSKMNTSATVMVVVESVTSDSMTIKVLSAPSLVRKLEKRNVLGVNLSTKARIMMGTKKILLSGIQPGDRMTLRGYVQGSQFIATSVSARRSK